MINFFRIFASLLTQINKKMFQKLNNLLHKVFIKSNVTDTPESTIDESIIISEIRQISSKLQKDVDDTNDYYRKTREKINSTCPACKGKNVTKRFKKFEGKINGSTHGYSSSALTFGSGYLSGSISGNFDTKEINKCNDCENEWKIAKLLYQTISDEKDNQKRLLVYYLNNYYDAENVTYDPYDVSEKYNSLEEKQTELFDIADNNPTIPYLKNYFSGVHIETIKELFKNDEFRYKMFKQYYNDEHIKNLGIII